jgi:prepilin peptidase CpaA
MDALSDISLLSLALTSSATDLLYRRIPNLVIVAGGLVAIGLAFESAGLSGLAHAVGGILLALALLLPLYALRLIGAGDVKLAAAIGGYTGAVGIVEVLITSAILAGLFAIAYAAHGKRLRALNANIARFMLNAWMTAAHGIPQDLRIKRSIGSMPYAPCLALGCLAWRVKVGTI